MEFIRKMLGKKKSITEEPRFAPGGAAVVRARPTADNFQDEALYLSRILLLGERMVGKTKLMIRFGDANFQEGFLCIVGMDFKINTRCSSS